MTISPGFGPHPLRPSDASAALQAGTVQPHGLLLVVCEPRLRIVQASTSASVLLQRPLESLLLGTLHDLGGTLAARVSELAAGPLSDPQPLRCTVGPERVPITLEGAIHRIGPDALVIELEPAMLALPSRRAGPRPAGEIDPSTSSGDRLAGCVDASLTADLGSPPISGASLMQRLGGAVGDVCQAPSIEALLQLSVGWFHQLFGHDRVTAMAFDDRGHARVGAEVHGPGLPPLDLRDAQALCAGAPGAADGRSRVLLVADVRAVPSELVPRLLPGHDPAAGWLPASGHDGADETELLRSHLRQPDRASLQALASAGAVSVLVVDLVLAGRTWGCIACHDPAPRRMGWAARAAAELLAEVVATRISALENHAQSQVEMQVRRLEQRLLEATAAEGDWRQALFRNPQTLLLPMGASGAVLWHEGEVLACGRVPESAQLHDLLRWLRALPLDVGSAHMPFACSAIEHANPAFAALAPWASGLLAVGLSPAGDCLVWMRPPRGSADGADSAVPKAGRHADPQAGSGALPWNVTERALAAAFGRTLSDVIVQVNAVRLLIAERQLADVKAAVGSASEPVVIAGSPRRKVHANAAFLAMAGRHATECDDLDKLAALFDEPSAAHRMIGHVCAEQRPWSGEMALRLADGGRLPVAIRAEPVPERNGTLLGTVFIFEDLTPARAADAARAGLDAELARAARALKRGAPDDLAGAILANASLAAMDISDGGAAPAVAPLLSEVHASTERASALLLRLKRYSDGC